MELEGYRKFGTELKRVERELDQFSEKRQQYVDATKQYLDELRVQKGVPKLITITPQMAQAFYFAKAKNRSIAKSNFFRILKDVRAGKWKVTGETIIFNDMDQLIDGQHRLAACIEANIPIQSYVVRGGIDQNAVTSIDIGKGRTPGDLLTFAGEEDANHLAATCRWVNRINNDGMMFDRDRLSRDELLQMIKDNPEIYRSMYPGRWIRKLILPSLGSALHFLMAQKDRDLADVFFHDLREGTAAPGSPTFVVRELLIKNKLHRAQLPVHIVAAMIIKAWNLLRSGRTAKIIRWYGESQGEAYPKIR